MNREEAIEISSDELEKLSTLDEVIWYLKDCYNRGINVYCTHRGEKLYSCDNYSVEEYWILATGMSKKDQKSIDELIYGNDNRTTEDRIRLNELVEPIYSYLEEKYRPIREELRAGKKSKGSIKL